MRRGKQCRDRSIASVDGRVRKLVRGGIVSFLKACSISHLFRVAPHRNSRHVHPRLGLGAPTAQPPVLCARPGISTAEPNTIPPFSHLYASLPTSLIPPSLRPSTAPHLPTDIRIEDSEAFALLPLSEQGRVQLSEHTSHPGDKGFWNWRSATGPPRDGVKMKFGCVLCLSMRLAGAAG